MKNKIIVIGAGISGLVATKTLLNYYKAEDIIVIEKDERPGGLLSGIFYNFENEIIHFEKGTHIPKETGIKFIDNYFETLLKEDINYLESKVSDYAGNIFNSKLNTNSIFPDFRKLDDIETIKNEIDSLINNLKSIQTFEPLISAKQYSNNKFGEYITNRYIIDIINNMYDIKFDNLSSFALKLPSISRLILDDFDKWNIKRNNEFYRDIIACPDQFLLPNELKNKNKNYYPNKYGNYSLISKVINDLKEKGVEFIFGFKRLNLNLSEKIIHVDERKIDIELLISSIGVFGSSFLLEVNNSDLIFSKPLKHRIINLIFDKDINNEVHYINNYDSNNHFYRITNYSGFTDVKNKLTIEVLGKEEFDDDRLLSLIIDQIKNIQFIDANSKILFSDIITLKNGFPSPSILNFQNIQTISERIQDKKPSWFLSGGIGSRKGVFFQNEVVCDMYYYLNEELS